MDVREFGCRDRVGGAGGVQDDAAGDVIVREGCFVVGGTGYHGLAEGGDVGSGIDVPLSSTTVWDL
ncbi:MAG: hypothetical protein WKF83_11805 [Nocardioidaceae bacterium]